MSLKNKNLGDIFLTVYTSIADTLTWIQNSVFEGELSEAKLRELKLKIKGIIDQSEDSIIIFTNKIGYNMDKQILGKERMSTDNFL
ncbi:CRISPR-associated endonuclease Cas2 [uncultured Prevotella sp.]|uniref:CRISPR-associated endonuclease Cas2 n=1 Tax=uncultured Prevotella sp. TaxID=159272 RepID=UPI0025826600|nr:CRISPR-associated endonuclease Cas2 [uncultured Prevotella sp.]